MKKPNIKKMLNAIKGNAKPSAKKDEKPKSFDVPGVKDMRQHAIDIGAHDAKDYFLGGTA